MFRRLHDTVPASVTVQIEDRPVRARVGENVAAVMLVHGLVPFRTSAVSGAPRAPYCMIGNCFECLVEIDGRPNRQACLETVREGMRIRRQRGAPAVTP